MEQCIFFLLWAVAGEGSSFLSSTKIPLWRESHISHGFCVRLEYCYPALPTQSSIFSCVNDYVRRLWLRAPCEWSWLLRVAFICARHSVHSIFLGPSVVAARGRSGAIREYDKSKYSRTTQNPKDTLLCEVQFCRINWITNSSFSLLLDERQMDVKHGHWRASWCFRSGWRSSCCCCCSPNSILFRMNNTMESGPSCKTNMTNKVICGPRASASPFREAEFEILKIFISILVCLGSRWRWVRLLLPLQFSAATSSVWLVPDKLKAMEEKPHGICLITFRTCRSFRAGADTR